MTKFLKHIEFCILRGAVASIPLFLCYLAITLLYNLVDRKAVAFLNRYVDVQMIPGLGLLLVLLILYLIGLIVGNIFGKSLLKGIEIITERIPVIKVIYGVGKQLSQSLDVSNEKSGFKKTVLVNLNQNNMLVPGFVTGVMIDESTGEEKTLVFLPTAPSPTQGFVTAVSKGQIIDPGWTVEEGLKIVVSAGIIAPKSIRRVLNV